MLADRRKRQGDLDEYSMKTRVDVYGRIASAIELAQIELDRYARCSRDHRPFDTQHLSALVSEIDLARATADLVGSPDVRSWAYRCRLAISLASEALGAGQLDKARMHRAKLHDARSSFVQAARNEVGVAPRGPEVAGDNHEPWFKTDPSEDALYATRLEARLLTPGDESATS